MAIVFVASWVMGHDGFPSKGIKDAFSLLEKVKWDHTIPVLVVIVIIVFRQEIAERMRAMTEGPYGMKFEAKEIAKQSSKEAGILTINDVKQELSSIAVLDKKKLESDAPVAHHWFLRNGIIWA